MTKDKQQRINDVYKIVDEVMKDKKIGVGDLILIARNTMETVETFKDISGAEKKELVLTVIKKYVIATVPNGRKKDDMLRVISDVLPNTIDLIITATRGELNINPIKFGRGMFSCFRLICC